MKITIINGIISDIGPHYCSDASVWIEEPTPGKNALIIKREKPRLFQVAHATVQHVIKQTLYADENEYKSAYDSIQNQCDMTYELITGNDIYGIGLRIIGLSLNNVDEIDYNNCYYY